jgi:hypothetical protein
MRILDAGRTTAPSLPRAALLSAERARTDERRWIVNHNSQQLELRAFAAIDEQHYSAYQDVAG